MVFWLEGKQVEAPWDTDTQIPTGVHPETGEMITSLYFKLIWSSYFPQVLLENRAI